MEKTKLGIPVGLLGAAMLFACYFGGYLVSFVLAGYILLFEENAWLKRTAEIIKIEGRTFSVRKKDTLCVKQKYSAKTAHIRNLKCLRLTEIKGTDITSSDLKVSEALMK